MPVADPNAVSYRPVIVVFVTAALMALSAIWASFGLVARVKALKVGDPVVNDVEVEPLILPKEVDRVASWIDEAVKYGARIATGGRRISLTTLEPTVLLDPSPEAKVTQLEVFGPVVCVYRYEKLDDAIAQANALPVAFQASIFAQDIDVALRAANRLDASAVMINDLTTFRTDWMPFAGRREFGYATGGIPFTMRDMTQEKMILMRKS
ncbi:aldehyde dehydrogenase family protein [Microvirga brassicacearum]|uniref:Aldehyde dehydrogenase family protein n=1 Tax=Microvirga brassicacearum TaxID=2580413 RepID=A0A5N3P5K8_9HYPH|nr:aldehyde dehydrogenase family protein [Microvirga brassicacearum]